MSDPAHVEIMRTIFNSLSENGRWGILRSGLLFERRRNELILIDRMPWQLGMPMSPAQLREQQDAEFEACKDHLNAAGIACWDSTQG